MSRAFVREPDGDNDFEDLPDKLISEHRNLVTADGLAHIEAETAAAQAAQAQAQAVNDRGLIARAQRDVRYWSQRRATAEVMPHPTDAKLVAFGSAVTIARGDGRRQTFRIVGEDQADPTKGTLSYVAPLAQALMGKAIGDVVRIGPADAEIVDISIPAISTSKAGTTGQS